MTRALLLAGMLLVAAPAAAQAPVAPTEPGEVSRPEPAPPAYQPTPQEMPALPQQGKPKPYVAPHQEWQACHRNTKHQLVCKPCWLQAGRTYCGQARIVPSKQ
jgi:hypothetical protein